MSRLWDPDGAKSQYELPDVGQLIGLDFQVWRVVSIADRDPVDWSDEDRKGLEMPDEEYADKLRPRVMVIRPVAIVGDDPRARDRDRHLGLRGGRTYLWHVYSTDDHYPVCVSCGGPTPCRELTARLESRRAAQRMARYEVEGICPSCQKPITQRQKVIRYEENLYVPGGPPVTYHGSNRECHSSALVYEDRWIDADPDRVARYRCAGIVTTHTEALYECTNATCPGPAARHRAYCGCRCRDHTNHVVPLAKDAVRMVFP